jgi:hypothetical protein
LGAATWRRGEAVIKQIDEEAIPSPDLSEPTSMRRCKPVLNGRYYHHARAGILLFFTFATLILPGSVDTSDKLLRGRGVLMTTRTQREFREEFRRGAVGLLEVSASGHHMWRRRLGSAGAGANRLTPPSATKP